MATLNKILLIGRVGKDPEIRNFDNGGSITNFSLATDESYKDRNGNKVQAVEWHNIEASGKIVGVIQQYVKKGDLLYVEGTIRTRSWQDKSGNNRYMTVVRLLNMTMLGGQKKQEGQQQAQQPTQQPQQENNYDNNGMDDLPF